MAGAVSDARLLLPLVRFLGGQTPSTVYRSDHLAAALAAAQGHEDVAAGVLAILVGQTQGAYLMWFRAEQLHSVHWAGDPHKPVEVGEFGERLTPRNACEDLGESIAGSGAVVSVSPALPIVWTWEVAIGEIFSNLIGNALR